MKHLRETFTDQEFAQIKEFKEGLTFDGEHVNWHDFIMMAYKALKGNMSKLGEEVKTE